MNILLVSQAYPPYAIVGAQRAFKVVEMLRARGHRVLVVTERLEGEGSELRVDLPDLEVHTVPLKAQYRLRVVGALNRLRPRRGPKKAAASVATEPDTRNYRRSKLGLVRRAAISLLWLPDDELRFVAPALKVARRLMSNQHVDLIYTTSPPHSSHLVGLRLRSSLAVRWIAEFRDPWTDQRSPERIEHWFGPAEAVHRWLEMRCLLAADNVVAVTNAARDLLAEKLPKRERGKVLVALNGIGEMPQGLQSWQSNSQTPFRIVHAGTFYLDRDPRPFLRALAALRQMRDLGPEELRVDFVGRCRSFDNISVVEAVEENGLSDIVNFHDWMEPAEAQAMMSEADLLLLLACSQPLQVPNKLFDYLGAQVPVLGIVDAGGESERMLTAVGGQYVVSVSKNEAVEELAIRRALELAFDERASAPRRPDETLLRQWSTAVQMESLAKAIGV